MVDLKSVEYASRKDGMRLLVLGAVHGNEVCGTAAIRTLMDELDRGAADDEDHVASWLGIDDAFYGIGITESMRSVGGWGDDAGMRLPR